MGCNLCELCNFSDPTKVWGSGKAKSNIMIINSYAGDDDEEAGIAVMPKSLKQRLESLGIDPREVYYTNLIKCRAPKGTKYKVQHMSACKPYILKEIKEVSPKFVLLLGAQATKTLIGENITEVNGVVIERGGISYVPSYSPGIVYRDPGKTLHVDRAFSNFGSLVKGKEFSQAKLNIKIITNLRELRRAFRYCEQNGYTELSYDIETTGLNRFEEDINLYGFGNNKVQYIIPLEALHSPLKGKHLVQKRLILEAIKWLNRPPIKQRIAGNGKFDNKFLKYHFGVRPKLTFDLILASHALNENTPNGVKENAILECNAHNWDINKNLKKGQYKTPKEYEEYLEYLGYDIYYEYLLYTVFLPRLQADPSIYKLFTCLYMPGVLAYEDSELIGVNVTSSKFKQARKHINDQLEEIEARLSKYSKTTKWSSTDQLRALLYDKYRLPVIETTESGAPSTSEATLKRLWDKHPLIPIILEYRAAKIQLTHFIDGWINRMHEGRLYPKFNLYGTVTGRTSSNDPNLQQVPRDPKIRGLLGAPKGWSMVEGDFSQAELRIASILSGDSAMKRIYQTGGDIHTHTYEMISGEKISEDKYEKKEQRKKAKAVNFGFVYGMGWRKFQEYARDTYGVTLSEKEAKVYRIKFFETYPKLIDWHTRQKKIVRSLGQVRNPIGRLRRLPDIYSSDKGKVAEAERQSINSPVQGFGSDLTVLGMTELSRRAKVYDKNIYKILKENKHRYKIVGTIHDATLVQVRNDFLMEFVPIIKRVLENPLALEETFHFVSPIPIVVDVQVGPSWGSGKELIFDDKETWRSQVQDYLKELDY